MNADCLFQELSADPRGRCTVGMDSPAGYVTGSGTIGIDENSKNKVQVVIEEFQAPPEYGNSLVGFLNASRPEKRGTGTVVSISASYDERRIASFTMDTGNGRFTASSGLLMPFLGLWDKGTLSIVLNDLAFTPHTYKPPKYWFVPLQGPFEEHYIGRPMPTHPMALDGGGVITFAENGLGCGLQIFDPERKPSHLMSTYDAIAFGELIGFPGTLQETLDAVPCAFGEALSFALGADITAPWIELRAEDASLARRFYFRVGHASSSDGFPAFTDVSEFRPDSGIGPFLTAFLSLSEEKRQALIAPLNLMRSGAPGSFNMEDSITDLVKALDNLCQARGLTTQDLLPRLEQDNRDKLLSILAETRKHLAEIVSENKVAGRQDQVDILNVIVSRVANVKSRSRDFGVAVKDLLRDLGLHDADVLDRHYGSLDPPGSWSEILSAVRGEVIHNGILRIKDVQSLRSWFDFSRHLHDLCKRVILREVKYSGTYQSSLHSWKGEYAVDRVTPTMTVKDLGFSQVPTHISV